MSSYLRLYSASDLISLFLRVTGWKVDEVYVEEFRRWLERQQPSRSRRMLPQDFSIWLHKKMHEYIRLNR